MRAVESQEPVMSSSNPDWHEQPSFPQASAAVFGIVLSGIFSFLCPPAGGQTALPVAIPPAPAPTTSPATPSIPEPEIPADLPPEAKEAVAQFRKAHLEALQDAEARMAA